MAGPACTQPPADGDVRPRFKIGFGQRASMTLIRGYQLAFSPFYAGSCRYVPSCSAYALEAIERFGAMHGGWLALRRLVRCHPFGGHGLDPVPSFAPAKLRRGRSDEASSGHPLENFDH